MSELDIDTRKATMKYVDLIRNIVNQDDDKVIDFFVQLGNLMLKKMDESSDPFFGTETNDSPADLVNDFARLYDNWSTMDSDSKNADAARMITNLLSTTMKQRRAQYDHETAQSPG